MGRRGGERARKAKGSDAVGKVCMKEVAIHGHPGCWEREGCGLYQEQTFYVKHIPSARKMVVAAGFQQRWCERFLSVCDAPVCA